MIVRKFLCQLVLVATGLVPVRTTTYDSFLNDISGEELKALLTNSPRQNLLRATKRPDYDTTDAPSSTNPDWMSTLPDNTPLTAMSIPGSHNTMARYGGPWAECQAWSLMDIYYSGVRYVDIRTRHFNDELPIHHGIIFQKHGFQYVLQQTVEFLDTHPTETILMRVKEEYKSENNKKRYEEVVNEHLRKYVPGNRLWDKPYIPTLGEARGKIVVLRDFVDYRWTHYRLFDIADQYDVPSIFHVDEKWKNVQEHLEKARNDRDYQGYLTHTSGSSALAFPSAVATRVNEKLWKYVKDKTGKIRWGIMVMDFPGVDLIAALIKNNF